MSEELQFLDLDDLLAAAQAALGARQVDVRDMGLLEAAAHRPRATVFGEDAYPGIDAKAAALLHSVVRTHPLVDGNKRLGWVAVRLFYGMNGYRLTYREEEAYELVIAVADGSLVEVEKIAEALRSWRD